VGEEHLMRVTSVQTNGTLQPFASGVGLVYGLAFDPAGDLYATGASENTIRKIATNGAVSVFVTSTALGVPTGLAADSTGNLFTCGLGGAVNRITSSGTITQLTPDVDGTGLAHDAAGNLYVASGEAVIKIDSTGAHTTFASGFDEAWGVAFDHAGNLFVSDNTANSIFKVTSSGTVSVFATGINRPTGLAFDSNGDLYVCSSPDSPQVGSVVKVTPTGAVSTFAIGLNSPTAIAIPAPVVVNTNHPPVAQCTNVVVSAGADCTGSASVNNGSFDPDGDAITVTQVPAGPYALGTTPVTLTVTDSQGATDSCQATVTVVDTTPPEITAARVEPAVLWPPNHKMVNINVMAEAIDNCGSATWKIVSVTSNQSVAGPGVHVPDWVITGDHTLQLRAERANGRADRIYTITLQATDASNNVSAPKKLTVTVPDNQAKPK
jgi:hypothetical protein